MGGLEIELDGIGLGLGAAGLVDGIGVDGLGLGEAYASGFALGGYVVGLGLVLGG